jgi:hypothetical protein
MQCHDRIVTQLFDATMGKVHELHEQRAPAVVALRGVVRGRRIHLSIAKTLAAPKDAGPVYRWWVREADESPEGRVQPGAPLASGSCADPEDAYWSAIDAVPHPRPSTSSDRAR